MKVTAIFDIGKTNKKFFLFDEKHQEVFKAYTRFEEIMDDDGFPADDLAAIQKWIRAQYHQLSNTEEYEITGINFSTYGASFVHIDEEGKPLTPLYNYLKPYPAQILESFYDKYGDELKIAKETASPPLGMLNSGLQLYWLKYAKPEIFAKIRWSLHLPQYLSYLFTGIPISDYTSIGCHTFLWNYEQHDYHEWVYAEGIDKILPPIATSGSAVLSLDGGSANLIGRATTKIGPGIHDSSGALIPYLLADSKPFLLLSTGTWSIALNPFNDDILTDQELKQDCLNFMRVDGHPVKASRLFLGNEYKLQVEQLRQHYQCGIDAHKQVAFDVATYKRLTKSAERYYHFESIQLPRTQPDATNLEVFDTFEEAYHQLMIELVELQVASAKLAIGNTSIRKIYLDGGFADNDIFIQLLAIHLPNYKLRTTQSPLGSALGAAMTISENKVGKKFLKKNYRMNKFKPTPE